MAFKMNSWSAFTKSSFNNNDDEKKTKVTKVKNCLDPNIVCSEEEHDLFDKKRNRVRTQNRAKAGSREAFDHLENNPK